MIPEATAQVISRRQWWRSLALSLLMLALSMVLVLRFARLAELERLLISTNRCWLLVALVSKLLVPFLTAVVYRAILYALGYRLKIVRFWLAAQVAGFVNAAFPAGPLAMSVFLARIFRQRGIPEGVTIVAVVLDTVTYHIVFYSLFVCGLAYALTRDGQHNITSNYAVLFAIALLLISGYLWLRRYDRAQITQIVVRIQQTLARWLRRPWYAITVERFLDQVFHSVDLLRAQPIVVGRLLIYQLGVILLDIFTLYCLFRALGSAPPFIVIVLGATAASVITTLAPLPGGGGAFEAILVLATTRVGVPIETALGATLIYRLLTFWLPLLLTLATYRNLISQQGAMIAPETQPASTPE